MSTLNMKRFTGTKTIWGRPMTRGEYNEYRGWKIPENENRDEHGFLMEYEDGESNDPRHKGYISWMPNSLFHKIYRYVGLGMTFGNAVELLKLGHKMTRGGWNGKGMYIYLVGPGRYPPSTPAGEQIAESHTDGLVPHDPYIAMKTVRGSVVPWLASQGDVLGEDWEIVE
jgi:hypothetical protein